MEGLLQCLADFANPPLRRQLDFGGIGEARMGWNLASLARAGARTGREWPWSAWVYRACTMT